MQRALQRGLLGNKFSVRGDKLVGRGNPIHSLATPDQFRSSSCDVFINHRGTDTKRNAAGLLFYHLARVGLHPFLDSKNMKPGDKLFDKIDTAIRSCKVGVAVFSPCYCDSFFCLHELALLMESRKRVIPIFYNVKPSQLRVKDSKSCPPNDLRRFTWALEEAKYTVGITFDSSRGYVLNYSYSYIENSYILSFSHITVFNLLLIIKSRIQI